MRHHREHDLDVAVHRGAGQRPQLGTKDVGLRKRKTEPAHAEEWVALSGGRQSRNRLIAARVERANRYRTVVCPFDDAPIRRILLFLVGQPLLVVEQKLGADKPNAVANCRIEIG